MGRTTIEVDDSVRDRLRVYKDSHGMTYDGAINRLLANVGEPVPTDNDARPIQDRTGGIYDSDIITRPETVGMCSFHEHFLSNNFHPVVFGGEGEADLSWDEFRTTLDGVNQYLPTDVTRSSFSIHQDGHAWYGYGLGSFLNALADRDNRYERAGITDPHHTETAVYLCRTEWGLLCIGLQAGTHRANHLTIRFMTDGTPLTPYPYATLTQQMNLDLSNAHEQEIEQLTIENGRDLDEPDIVDTITRDPDRHDGPIVRGLVIRNPFYDDLDRLRTVTDNSSAFKYITTYEHIPCYLAGHHPTGEDHDYEIRKFTMYSYTGLTSGFTFTNVECRGSTLFRRDR
jgi:hypothetical protein